MVNSETQKDCSQFIQMQRNFQNVIAMFIGLVQLQGFSTVYLQIKEKKKVKTNKQTNFLKFLSTKMERNSIKVEMRGRFVFLELTEAQL